MSICYTIEKAGFSFDSWKKQIDQFVCPCDPGTTPEGTWREMLVSNLLRHDSDSEEEKYAVRFLTEGSIRGVLVSEEDTSIDLILNIFASRSDQYLAARMAWEALSLGALVTRDGEGPLTTTELSGEAIEALHREWFALGKASVKGKEGFRMPIHASFLLTLEKQDVEKSDDELERELIARVAQLGDAFISTRMQISDGDQGSKLVGILQADMPTLIMKDVEALMMQDTLVPISAALTAVGNQVVDGFECWVFPPTSQIDMKLVKAVASLSTLAAGPQTKSNEPNDAEWKIISYGPVLAFIWIAASDGKVDQKEVASFSRSLDVLGAQEKHRGICRMIQLASANIEEILSKLLSGKENPVVMLDTFRSVIDNRFSKEEANIMKGSLLYIGHKVAESSGGFLGFGSKISKDEKNAMAALAGLLGLS